MVNEDDFAVRWTGLIEPLFSDTTSFHIVASDGVRLIINGEEVIDNFVGGYFSEKSGKLYLEGGKKYPIQLDYFEVSGEAQIIFSWSSDKMTKTIVPKRQLFNFQGVEPAQVEGYLWWDDNQNGTWDTDETPISDAIITLRSAGSDLVVQSKATTQDGFYSFTIEEIGQYYVECSPASSSAIVLPSKGFLVSGKSSIFFVQLGDTLTENRSFARLEKAPFEWSGDVQLLSLSPNPGKSALNVGFHLHDSSFLDIELFDNKGAKVYQRNLEILDAGFHRIELFTAAVPAGMYQVVLRTVNGKSTGLWVKI